MHHVPPRLLARRLIAPVSTPRRPSSPLNSQAKLVAQEVRTCNLLVESEFITVSMDADSRSPGLPHPLELAPIDPPSRRAIKPAPRIPREQECHLIEFLMIGLGCVGLIFLIGAALALA